MPEIDTTPIGGLAAHTKRESFGDDGHLSNTLYVRDGIDMWVSLRAGGTISVNIGGFGGSSAMVFTPAQCDLIFAHVNAVRAQAVAE
mgnify:CR=1 FL=1